ncbi:MAG: AraC family transcriptional regulator [Lachnospirales bacterium]
MYSYTTDKANYDFNLLNLGMEKCHKGHFYGPAVRSSYLFHYICSGEGSFTCYTTNKTYHLQRGNGFLIHPDMLTYYEASLANPWTYYWIAFTGSDGVNFIERMNLSIENPIYQLKKNLNHMEHLFKEFINVEGECKNLRLFGYSQIIFSYLIEMLSTKENYNAYVEKAINYVAVNYHREISAQDLANINMLNRVYFSNLFKKEVGVSPKKYITDFKINKAKELLFNRAFSIGDVSRSVGFNDPLTFSKIFKKEVGVSPRDFRR